MKKSKSQVICGIVISDKNDQKVLKLMSDAKNLPSSDAEFQRMHSGYQAFRLRKNNSLDVNNVLIAA